MGKDKLELQQRAYDKFRTFAHRYMRKRNHSLTLVGFNDHRTLKKPTTIRVVLKNCFTVDTDLMTVVKQFHPDCRMEVKQNLQSDGKMYHVYVPWGDNEREKRHRHSHRKQEHDDDTAPSPMVPMMWTVAFAVLAAVASATTTAADWKAFLG